jgi:hypothetical protein
MLVCWLFQVGIDYTIMFGIQLLLEFRIIFFKGILLCSINGNHINENDP